MVPSPLRHLKSRLKQERRCLVKLQRKSRKASSASATARRHLRLAQRDLQTARVHVARLRANGQATTRAHGTVERCKAKVLSLKQCCSQTRRGLQEARKKRKAQALKLEKVLQQKEKSEHRLKVEALRVRQLRAVSACKHRESVHKRLLDKKQALELKSLLKAQASTLKALKTKHAQSSAALREKSSLRLKSLKSKHQESATAYKKWLHSEESRHADQFKRCVGGSLGNSLCILRPKAGKHTHTLVYLHQFNCEGFGYAYWKPHYFYSSTKFRFNGLKIVFPTATTIPISAHDGNETVAWYDYLTDFDGVREDKVNMSSLRDTRNRIFNILDREINLLGGDASRVFIGGASQGCCTALHCAMQFPRVLGGFVGVVGHLLSCTPVPASKRHMPVSLYCGREDRIMRWSWVRKTFRRFEDANFTKLSLRCEPGVGHDTGPKEREWLIDFLSQCIKVPEAKSKA